MEKIEFTFDVQLLVEGDNVTVDKVKNDIAKLKGDSLLVVGDDGFARVHFHSNQPWDVLKCCAAHGTIHDIVVENMEKQQEAFA